MRGTVLIRLIAATGIAVVAAVVIALTNTDQPVNTASSHHTQPTTTVQPAPTTTPAPSLIARPGGIPLDHVNPCHILTSAQRDELRLDSTPVPYTDPEFDHARACSMRSMTAGTETRLALVTSMGVDVWLDDTAQVSATATTASGYPALVVRTPGLSSVCDVEVDAADNEFLDVMVRDGGNTPPIPQDTLCGDAEQVADAAVTSLPRHD